MRLQHPLSVITPTADADVLTALARASKPFTAGQLQGLIGHHSISGIRKVLHRLTREGIVTSESIGNAIAYRFNAEHLAAPAIIALTRLQATYVERLRQALTAWDPPPAWAAMFGSAARGEMTASSDVDLFIVRPDGLDGADLTRWDDNVMTLQQAAHTWTGNDVRALEMAESEVVAHLRTEPVLEAIRYDGISLYGSSGFWRRTYAKNRLVQPGDD